MLISHLLVATLSHVTWENQWHLASLMSDLRGKIYLKVHFFSHKAIFFYFRKQCMLLLDIYGLFLSPVLSFYEKSSLFLGIKERNTVLETHESEEMTGMSFLGELFFYACFSYSWWLIAWGLTRNVITGVALPYFPGQWVQLPLSGILLFIRHSVLLCRAAVLSFNMACLNML